MKIDINEEQIKGLESQKSISERIKSYDDILKELGDKAEALPYINPINSKQKSINAYVKLVNVCEAFNEGWIPDWNNDNEKKYYPWFYMDGDFRWGDMRYFASFSYVTAHLCFKNEELVELSVYLFLDIYKDYYEYK